MTKKLILVLVAAALSFSLVSCKSKTETSDTADKENKPAVEETKDPSQKTDENKTDKSDNKDNTAANTDNNKTSSSDNKLSVYSIDENTLEPNKTSDISVADSSSLQDKLQQLSNEVSKDYFEGLPIKVKSIDTVDGKKIATINLVDGTDGSSWTNKFQGSAGGQITANTLIENFLQVSYKGEWIDGVKFLYNDAPIEYDHVYELSQTQYRN